MLLQLKYQVMRTDRASWLTVSPGSPQVITDKIQKDGRTKLLTSTPRRKLSLLLISKTLLY